MIDDELKDIGRIVAELKRYVRAQGERGVYKVAAAFTRTFASMVYVALATLLILCLILFSGVMLGFGFADWFDLPVWIGFLIVLGLYVIALGFMAMFKKQILTGLRNAIASQIIGLIDEESGMEKTKNNNNQE